MHSRSRGPLGEAEAWHVMRHDDRVQALSQLHLHRRPGIRVGLRPQTCIASCQEEDGEKLCRTAATSRNETKWHGRVKAVQPTAHNSSAHACIGILEAQDMVTHPETVIARNPQQLSCSTVLLSIRCHRVRG